MEMLNTAITREQSKAPRLLQILLQDDTLIGGGTEETNHIADTYGHDVLELILARRALGDTGNTGITFRDVPFYLGTRLKTIVWRDVYHDTEVTESPNRDHYQNDDFKEVVGENGEHLCYEHFVHGDCGITFFTVDWQDHTPPANVEK